MQQEKATHHLATLCRVMGVSPSGYYAWCDRSVATRAQIDQSLLAQIRDIHEQSRGIYGAPRIVVLKGHSYRLRGKEQVLTREKA
jgi:putative transposase